MTRRIVDLTYAIHEGMTTYPSPWHPVVEVTILGRHGIENRETRKIVLGTHTGTHCDAPRHFVPGGETIETLPLDLLIGPALLLDFSNSPPLRAVDVDDLERQMGSRTPTRLILRYDWSDHWGTMEFYTRHPYLTEAAARWLVDRGVRLLAMDTPTPDNPAHGRNTDQDSPNHKTLLGNGVILVEYLCNLKAVRAREVELLVMPIKLQEGDGAPARCAVIEP